MAFMQFIYLMSAADFRHIFILAEQSMQNNNSYISAVVGKLIHCEINGTST